MENVFLAKERKKSQRSNAYIRQDRLLNKDCNRTQRILHNDKGINKKKRCNSCKYIGAQPRNT